ncbi:MAG: HD domain-containing protein, partial [Planctomycetes bacterium]|nr:HD domain-containing protein [Planctomycetota bacterium]
PVELRSRVELHFRLRESQTATATLQQEVQSHHVALKHAAVERTKQMLAIQDVAVFTLAKVAESRDNETGTHLLRMREYSQRLAQELASDSPYAHEIDAAFLGDLYRSSPLHDIGKVGIPDAILLKPGRLTAKEFEVMKRHTVIGSNILNEAVMQLTEGGFLTMGASIAQFHHERWDGQGYPAGLVADEILTFPPLLVPV